MQVCNKPHKTIREAYVEASSFLRANGVREPEANAERLLAHVLGETRSGMLLRWSEPFPQGREAAWTQALKRKANGEPVQYIIGEQEFYGLSFRVTPAVLIPRPETELLVEEIIRLGRKLFSRDGFPTVCDIGTGSGAIALTIAAHCPSWRILASDISQEALAAARVNAERLGIGERVHFAKGDLLEPWIAQAESIDILVSNPPYIPDSDEAGLQPEVRLYEPRTALFGGPDGLLLYKRLIGQLVKMESLPFIIGFEVGEGQAQDVSRMLKAAADWDEVRIISDYAGIERHVVAYRGK